LKSNFVEHPELIAKRIARYANFVGRDNVIAGSDCGFGTWIGQAAVDPDAKSRKDRRLCERSLPPASLQTIGSCVDIDMDRIARPHLADLGFLVIGGDRNPVRHKRDQRLARRVGPTVRIRFPPAASPLRTRPVCNDSNMGRSRSRNSTRLGRSPADTAS
jgi:hypothetical protein